MKVTLWITIGSAAGAIGLGIWIFIEGRVHEKRLRRMREEADARRFFDGIKLQ
jgi:hypothetical protein